MTRNKKTAASGLTLMLSIAALAGCSGPAGSARTAPPSAPATGKDIGKTQAAKAPEKAILAGKVAEIINVGSYTYINVEKDGKRGWAAVPAVDVKVGDEVELIPGIDMGQFTSATLKKTFENIHFSAGLKQGTAKTGALPAGHPATAPAAAAALPSGHPKIDGMQKSASEAAPAAGLVTGKVVETANAGGYTYICLEKDGNKTWAAIPVTQVSVGSDISLLPGSEMTDFNSPSLKRTFDKIIFSPGAAGK